jgi:ATP phosphoribosyltransferase regulatory subunit
VIVEPPVPPAVLAAIRAPFEGRGAVPIDPPVLLPLSLLLDLAGEAMRARLFVVQGDGGEEAALRPDFTVAVARSHIEAGLAEGRHLYEGRAFRAAPPGSDRPREFLQIGLEALGETPSPEADAEVTALAWASARAGGREDLELLLGDVALFDAFTEALEVLPVWAARLHRALAGPAALLAALTTSAKPAAATASPLADLLAHRPEAEAAAVLEDLWALAGVTPIGGRSAAEIARRLIARAAESETPPLSAAAADVLRRLAVVEGEPLAALDAISRLGRGLGAGVDEALERSMARVRALETAGVSGRQRFVAAFGRPFGYYDGFLFEVRSGALGPDAPVAAGGRYDRLPLRLGGRAAGAVGCMVRPYRAWAGAPR